MTCVVCFCCTWVNEVRGNARCDPPEDWILHQDLEKSPVGIRTTKKETEVMKIFQINKKKNSTVWAKEDENEEKFKAL